MRISDWSSDVCSSDLPPVIRGEMVVAVSMSEPHAGTALTDLTTRARIDGDAIVLDGQKRWSSGGGHADAYVVYCRLSEAPRSDERRVGQECVRPCRSRWTRYP